MVRNMWVLGCLAVLAGGLLSGCLDVDQQISVRPDGKGTFTQTVYISKDFVQQMAAMGSDANGGPPPDMAAQLLSQMMSDEQFKTQAKKMGEGVTFEAAEKIKASDGRQGYKAVFRFEDITKVKMPVGDAPQVGPGEPGEQAAKETVTFEFTAAKGGTPAKLVLNMPKPKAAAVEDQQEEMDEMGQAMAAQFMKDLKMRLSIKVEGDVTAVEASHADKAKGEVTIMKVDMAGLSKDAKLAPKLADILKALKSPEKIKAMVKDPGMKGIDKYVQFEEKEKITIEFTAKKNDNANS